LKHVQNIVSSWPGKLSITIKLKIYYYNFKHYIFKNFNSAFIEFCYINDKNKNIVVVITNT